MSKFAQILRDQLAGKADSAVLLLLRSGKELSGVVDYVGEDFVVLKRKGSYATTIVLDEIVAFDFPDGTMVVEENVVLESEIHTLTRSLMFVAPTPPVAQPLTTL